MFAERVIGALLSIALSTTSKSALKVLWKSDHLAVVAKPALVPCHSYEITTSRNKIYVTADDQQQQQQQQQQDDTVLQRAYATFLDCPSIHLVHRLDAPTSGCLLFAFSSAAAREAQAAMTNRNRTTKTYFAICRGNGESLKARGAILEDGDVRDSKGKHQTASTIVECVCGSDGSPRRCCLVRATPQTGRWHQVRQHLGRLDHPIIMETKHHPDRQENRAWKQIFTDRPRLCLHCHRLQIKPDQENRFLPSSGIDVWCPLPQDMQSIIDMTDWAGEARAAVPELFLDNNQGLP